MTAFDENGRTLWKAAHPHLPSRTHDMGQAVRSAPCIEGKRAYYVSNRGEFICLDLEGFSDAENDGSFTGETNARPSAADIIWKIDMMAELGVFKREAGDVGNPTSSPIIIGDLVYCVTGHGGQFTRSSRWTVDPLPPSFLAVDKRTGKIAWSSNAPGTNILLGQWSSPVHARVKGTDQVIFPGGDGWLYGFAAQTGSPSWKLDCNEPGAKEWFPYTSQSDHLLKGKNSFVAAPVVKDSVLYVGLNKHFEAPSHAPLLAIDLATRDGQPRVRWKFNSTNFVGTWTSAAVADGIVFVTSQYSVLFAIEANTGRELWQARLDSDAPNPYSGPTVNRGRVYVGSESGVTVFAAAREKKCLGRYELNGAYASTPIVVDDRIYVSAEDSVWALRVPESQWIVRWQKIISRVWN